jgi:N4-gp56 family major capsid protein
MAVTSYSVGAAEAVKLWSRRTFREALKSTSVSKFFGTTTDSLIQILDEANKGPGDRITTILRMQLNGAGIIGDNTLEGQEEALTTYTDNIFIDQLRHAVRSAGRVTEQRIPFSIREEIQLGLSDWWQDRISTWFFNQACSNTAVTDTRFSGLQSVAPADTAHNFIAGTGFTGGANSAALLSDTVSDRMQLSLIDMAVAQAKTISPMIRPLMIDGAQRYVMFLHPYQVKDLRVTTGTGTWQDIQKAALMGGQYSDNALFTGALGMYNNVILHEDPRVPLVSDFSGTAIANTRAAVLCGAQAATLAFGRGYGLNGTNQILTWVEEKFDFENQFGVAAGLVGGMKKSVYNGMDFGTIRVGTWATAP